MSEKHSGKRQRKFRNLIINASFQSKIIVLVSGIVLLQAILTSGYLYIKITGFLEKSMTGIYNFEDLNIAVKELGIQLMWGVGIANIEFLIFAFVISLFFSHRLAGPNYAIKRAINNLLDGVDHHEISLRKGDEFHDLAERINALFSDYHLVPKNKTPEEEIETDQD